ncbi:hypothetical protein QJS04_geneDACA007021 [Acorus gramineus]|uniref:Uncharacterized protein n=1 Tax=Acorus gramineus TaxID=55184 RepID=A0AAV9A2L5_ACOGR|nr:hypothetical protein QJS04_geneDACA007021 [Acorus gramineus]
MVHHLLLMPPSPPHSTAYPPRHTTTTTDPSTPSGVDCTSSRAHELREEHPLLTAARHDPIHEFLNHQKIHLSFGQAMEDVDLLLDVVETVVVPSGLQEKLEVAALEVDFIGEELMWWR